MSNKFRYLILALLIVLPFEILSFYSIHLSPLIEIPLFLVLIIFFGKEVFISGFRSLLKLNFSDINLLMTIAIFGALYLREFEEAVIVVILFALGNALEDYGIERSQTALEELVNKTPKAAFIKGHSEKTPIEAIHVNDVLVVKPGDYIPLDGTVLSGSSLIDESPITGEPLPKSKYKGDLVYAGSMNGEGYMEIQVTKTVKDTTLNKIIELTYQSAEKKSQSQKFIEKFAQYYTPSIMTVALLLVVIPVAVFKQPFNKWFTEALTLLLISCPCALVISTPVTVFSAIGNATKRGLLIKGGRFLEEMGKINVLALDKTRTLTKGEPVVADIIPYNGGSKEELLACVSGAEMLSEHPVAKSIVSEAQKEHLKIHPFVNFKAIMGKGVKGECSVCLDKHHCMGTLKFITEEHTVSQDIIKKVEEFEKQGKTTIVVSDNKKVTGIISVTDEIRPESQSAISQLMKLHVTPVMLTGDNAASADFVAKEIGVSEVNASLLPDEKVAAIRRYTDKGEKVAMVGDGVNDSPALATANVGIAMGAIGSDVAVENADIALMNNNLLLLPYLVKIGRKTTSTIQFNTAMAIAVKGIFISLALTGMSNIPMAIFADVGVTLIVILNSLRLFNFHDGSFNKAG